MCQGEVLAQVDERERERESGARAGACFSKKREARRGAKETKKCKVTLASSFGPPRHHLRHPPHHMLLAARLARQAASLRAAATTCQPSTSGRAARGPAWGGVGVGPNWGRGAAVSPSPASPSDRIEPPDVRKLAAMATIAVTDEEVRREREGKRGRERQKGRRRRRLGDPPLAPPLLPSSISPASGTGPPPRHARAHSQGVALPMHLTPHVSPLPITTTGRRLGTDPAKDRGLV